MEMGITSFLVGKSASSEVNEEGILRDNPFFPKVSYVGLKTV